MAAIPSLPAILSPPLSGRDAVADALYRLILGLDSNDKDLFDSAITDDMAFTVNGKTTQGRETIHSELFSRIGKLDTTHHITNLRINILDGEKKASLTAIALAQHYNEGKGMAPEQPYLLIGSLYRIELVKGESDGQWRVEKFDMKTNWAQGEWSILLGN